MSKYPEYYTLSQLRADCANQGVRGAYSKKITKLNRNILEEKLSDRLKFLGDNPQRPIGQTNPISTSELYPPDIPVDYTTMFAFGWGAVVLIVAVVVFRRMTNIAERERNITKREKELAEREEEILLEKLPEPPSTPPEETVESKESELLSELKRVNPNLDYFD